MTNNVIYYGPPGTGKTYMMQNLISDYTDYNVLDKAIEEAYITTSLDWVLYALIIMQNNNPMTPKEILDKIRTLSFGKSYSNTPTDILDLHSINDSPMGTRRLSPRIFFEIKGYWYVDRIKVLEYDNDFITKYLSSDCIEKRYDFVTFHQSFVYEDFIEGIRPYHDKSTSTIGYEVQDGIFKQICDTARKNPHKDYALFIDEINRGNISEIFGELITLIEDDKRLGQSCELTTTLPYSKTEFGVPGNLKIVGSMNSADRSIAMLDIALRRRFEFINISCNYLELEITLKQVGINPHDIDGIDIIKLLKTINYRIEVMLDENYIIGHAYFIKARNFEEIKSVIIKKIIPLLEEYFFDDLEKIQLIFSDLDENGSLKTNAIYKHKELDVDDLFEYVGEYSFETKKSYYVYEEFNVDSVIKVYDGVNV
ncbi:McrB family protein [Tissierella praeacuta]|uniref:McrB family protein n=1 Tax=Tissierella praeacuta TaxID=43131 RepID=UPI0028A9831F|nr:AAA family ATPase [Tissierella praeacuta]